MGPWDLPRYLGAGPDPRMGEVLIHKRPEKQLVVRAVSGWARTGLGYQCPASNWWVLQVGQTGRAEEVRRRQPCPSLLTLAADTPPLPILSLCLSSSYLTPPTSALTSQPPARDPSQPTGN